MCTLLCEGETTVLASKRNFCSLELTMPKILSRPHNNTMSLDTRVLTTCPTACHSASQIPYCSRPCQNVSAIPAHTTLFLAFLSLLTFCSRTECPFCFSSFNEFSPSLLVLLGDLSPLGNIAPMGQKTWLSSMGSQHPELSPYPSLLVYQFHVYLWL